MATISKQQLKEEIDHLDNQYLELVYKILRQFPHDTSENVHSISLQGSVLHYIDQTEPVALNDWEVFK